MFDQASNFNQDLGAWDMSNVIDTYGMFSNAVFNQDIGSWDVSSVQPLLMRNMFYGAVSFNQDISGWCVSSITSEPNNFSNGSALTSVNKPVWEPALRQPQMQHLQFHQVTRTMLLHPESLP